MPSIISKSTKNAVLGAKMGHFRPQTEWGVSELFFSLSALKVDEVCQFSFILDIKKV